MKKIFLILIILSTVNFAFAETAPSDLKERVIFYLDRGLIVFSGDKNKQIEQLQEIIRSVQVKIDELKGVKVSEEESLKQWKEDKTSCRKISQTLWEGMRDSTESIYDTSGPIPSIKKESEFSGDIGVTRLNFFLSKFNFVSKDPVCIDAFPNQYSSCTTSGVKLFQKKYGIKQTGSVGPVTLAKINSMICK